MTLANVTVPGPLTFNQLVVTVAPAEKPVTVPFKPADEGKVMV